MCFSEINVTEKSQREHRVAVMMAVYNGENFLKDQLESIVNQTYKDWVLYVRDDGSSDGSVGILTSYANRFPGSIVLIDCPSYGKRGSKSNFAAIHNWVKTNTHHQYFMFADQDDIWLPNKIEVTVNKVKEVERISGGPVLVHSDLEVVDKDLNSLGDSFFAYRALNPEIKDIRHLLVQNNITGCTMAWNQQLNELVDLTYDNIVMHDWWMALVASSFGTIDYIATPTIKYRQHGNNVVGATKVNTISFVLKRLMGSSHVRKTLEESYAQASAFITVFNDSLNPSVMSEIEEFISIPLHSKTNRILRLIKGGYLKQGPVQVIGQLIFA